LQQALDQSEAKDPEALRRELASAGRRCRGPQSRCCALSAKMPHGHGGQEITDARQKELKQALDRK